MSDNPAIYFAHESAFIDEGVVIGEGTKIWHFCHVMSGAVLGKGCSLGQNVVVHGTVTVGNGVKIQNNVSLYDGVILEDDVFCGPSMVFTNVINPRSHTPRRDQYQRTLVKKGATLGANCTILCGNTIGEHAFVGAASLVTKDVPGHALVFGVPAVLKGWICTCGVRLPLTTDPEGGEQAACKDCGREFTRKGLVVSETGKKK